MKKSAILKWLGDGMERNWSKLEFWQTKLKLNTIMG